MSFGFSIGDFLMIINGVGKIISRLRGGASSEYRHYQEIYDNFVQVARFLNDYGNSWNSILGEDIKRIQKLLQYFLHEISRHKPYFDKRKRRAWLLRTTRRILWPFYSGKLEGLNKDLTSLMSSIMFKKQFLQGNPNFSKIFYLEDARGDTHTIDFVSISSWEGIHEFLLRVFPTNDKGREAIGSRRYLLHHVDSTTDDILCSNPYVQSFEDVVQHNKVIVMSVLFPYEESYEHECPECRTPWHAEIQGVCMICNGCNFRLRFRDSYDNEPDPITQLVLNDIMSSGKDSFIKKYDPASFRSNHRQYVGSDNSRPSIRSLIRDRLDDHRYFSQDSSEPSRSQITYFRRVTLCTTQWPIFPQDSNRQKAAEFSETLEGLRRCQWYLEAEDLPLAKFAALLGSRFWFARDEKSLLKFIRSILKAKEDQTPFLEWSPDMITRLETYISNSNSSGSDFHPSILETRCLLWMMWDVSLIEGEIFQKCSKLLDCWSIPNRPTLREKTPLPLKLFSLPHTVLMVPWRLTFDLAGDIIAQFKQRREFLPFAIRELVKRSGTIAFQFYLHGDLDNYVKSHPVYDCENVKSTQECKHWMEKVMRTEQSEFEVNGIIRELVDMMNDGFM